MFVFRIFECRPIFSRFLLIVLSCATIGFAGCAGSRPRATLPTSLPDAFPHHRLADIQRHLHSFPDSLQTFSARASVSMAIPSRSGSFSARMLVHRRDSLYMSIRVTFGIEAARTLVTPDSFFVYDRINKQLVFGPISYAQGFLPPPLSFGSFFPSLLGLIGPDPGIDWQVEADSARYYLRDPARLRMYVVDPVLWRVIRYEEKDASGTIIEDRTYTDFETVDGVIIPRRLVFRRPPDNAFASIHYRELKFNPAKPSFHLRVGNGVTPVPVQASH